MSRRAKFWIRRLLDCVSWPENIFGFLFATRCFGGFTEKCTAAAIYFRDAYEYLQMATEYRRTINTEIWHFCSNCSGWPTENYIVTKNFPLTYQICNDCLSKNQSGDCQWGGATDGRRSFTCLVDEALLTSWNYSDPGHHSDSSAKAFHLDNNVPKSFDNRWHTTHGRTAGDRVYLRTILR